MTTHTHAPTYIHTGPWRGGTAPYKMGGPGLRGPQGPLKARENKKEKRKKEKGRRKREKRKKERKKPKINKRKLKKKKNRENGPS